MSMTLSIAQIPEHIDTVDAVEGTVQSSVYQEYVISSVFIRLSIKPRGTDFTSIYGEFVLSGVRIII